MEFFSCFLQTAKKTCFQELNYNSFTYFPYYTLVALLTNSRGDLHLPSLSLVCKFFDLTSVPTVIKSSSQIWIATKWKMADPPLKVKTPRFSAQNKNVRSTLFSVAELYLNPL